MPAFDMNAMLAAFVQMMQAQQQGQLGQQREALGQNNKLGMYGGRLDPITGKEANNPFDNGFFKSAGERQQIEQNRGIASMPGPASLATNPYYPQTPQQQPQPAILPQTALMSTIMPPATGTNSAPAQGMFDQTMALLQKQRAPQQPRRYNLFQ